MKTGAVERRPRPDELYYVQSESRPGVKHEVCVWRRRRNREVRKATCSCEYRGEYGKRECSHLLAVLASRLGEPNNDSLVGTPGGSG